MIHNTYSSSESSDDESEEDSSDDVSSSCSSIEPGFKVSVPSAFCIAVGKVLPLKVLNPLATLLY